jgi:hypothetical protein
VGLLSVVINIFADIVQVDYKGEKRGPSTSFPQYLRALNTSFERHESRRRTLENAYKAVDTITYSWLVMAFLIILSSSPSRAQENAGRFQFHGVASAPSRQYYEPWKEWKSIPSANSHIFLSSSFPT